MSDHYAVIRLDTLLFTLGGFAELVPTKRDLWVARLKRMWLAGLLAKEIASELGTSPNNVRVHAQIYGLPRRRVSENGHGWRWQQRRAA